MKNHALYSVIFEDNTVFQGGLNYYNTKWLEIPEKKIKRIFYRLPDGHVIMLHKCEKYFHMIEAVQDLTGKRKGQQRVEYAYIMGKKQDKIVSYRITLFSNMNSKYRIGDITRREFDINHKKIKGLNPNGWK